MKSKTKSKCVRCKELFFPTYRRRSEKPQAFCSRRCFLLNRWGDPVALQCRSCGKAINAGNRKRVFCSFDCRVQSQIGKRRETSAIAYGLGGRYLAWLTPLHPFADSKGYVMEHRLVMERYLGRFLEKGEVVHHIDENPRNNVIENLRLMTKEDHDKHHSVSRWARKKAAKLPAPSV